MLALPENARPGELLALGRGQRARRMHEDVRLVDDELAGLVRRGHGAAGVLAERRVVEDTAALAVQRREVRSALLVAQGGGAGRAGRSAAKNRSRACAGHFAPGEVGARSSCPRAGRLVPAGTGAEASRMREGTLRQASAVRR